MSTPVTTVLAVDGNSLLHRAFHASARSGFRTADGRPAWAVRGLLSQLVAAVDRAMADAVVVGFDDPDASVRRERWPTYKAHRTPKPETLVEQLDSVVAVLRELGVGVVVPTGLEADDVLASVAAQAPAAGFRTVLATSDRDSFALVDEHTRVLRILNGGVDASPLLDPARLALVTGVRPDQYLDLAALRGDASDNLPGVAGFGAKTAAKLLGRARHRGRRAGRRRRRGRALPRRRRAGPRPHPGHRRGARAVLPQPRGDGDGAHRRRRSRRAVRAPAPGGVAGALGLRAPRPLRQRGRARPVPRRAGTRRARAHHDVVRRSALARRAHPRAAAPAPDPRPAPAPVFSQGTLF